MEPALAALNSSEIHQMLRRVSLAITPVSLAKTLRKTVSPAILMLRCKETNVSAMTDIT